MKATWLASAKAVSQDNYRRSVLTNKMQFAFLVGFLLPKERVGVEENQMLILLLPPLPAWLLLVALGNSFFPSSKGRMVQFLWSSSFLARKGERERAELSSSFLSGSS